MVHRIAAVQHGDYSEALRIIGRGEPEPYFGMAYSLRALGALLDDRPHLVISLDAPAGRERRGSGELVGLPRPHLPWRLPGTLAMLVWSGQIRRELARFRPTHVLLRSWGIPALGVLRYCVARRVSTLAIFANRFDDRGIESRVVTRRLVRLLNDPCVFLVGNHKRPATDSMLECGVSPAKVSAWDWPNTRHPRDWPAKSLDVTGGVRQVAYVGAMTERKGVGDLINAVKLLYEQGVKLKLVAAGSGPDLERMRARAAALPPGIVTLSGRVGNPQAFEIMLASDLVCVPSRHDFPEGMPLTLTEALASRTPTVISDHPVFRSAFVDGEGVCFFPAGDARALAAVIRRLLENREEYAMLSRSTLDAFRRVECTTLFGDLLDRWKLTF